VYGTSLKNAQVFNDWTAASPSSAEAAQAAPPAVPSKAAIGARSTYETPEERAQRQVLIVRQSSVSSAIAVLGAGAKAPLKLEEVLTTAQAIADFVFQVKSPGDSGFEDIPDFDVPTVD
jgi:hypothetical protein